MTRLEAFKNVIQSVQKIEALQTEATKFAAMAS